MDTQSMDLSHEHKKISFLTGAHIANTFITNEWKFNLAQCSHHSVNIFSVGFTYQSRERMCLFENGEKKL